MAIVTDYESLMTRVKHNMLDTKILILHATHKGNNSKMSIPMARVNALLDDTCY